MLKILRAVSGELVIVALCLAIALALVACSARRPAVYGAEQPSWAKDLWNGPQGGGEGAGAGT